MDRDSVPEFDSSSNFDPDSLRRIDYKFESDVLMLPRIQTKCVLRKRNFRFSSCCSVMYKDAAECVCFQYLLIRAHSVRVRVRATPKCWFLWLLTDLCSKLGGNKSGTFAWLSATTSETVWSRASILPFHSVPRDPPILGTPSMSCRRWIRHSVRTLHILLSSPFGVYMWACCRSMLLPPPFGVHVNILLIYVVAYVLEL